jgi:glycosyltransferase A (GT-A) superfamily protein (DUF2064 family)
VNILVFARAPRRGAVRVALEPLLGAEAATKVHALLLMRAIEWARSLTPDTLYVAYEPADAGGEVDALLGLKPRDLDELAAEHAAATRADPAPAHGAPRLVSFPQVGDGIAGRMRHAVGRVFEEHSGPVLIVWPDLPNLHREHGEAALADLAAGADIVLGPVFDGGFYLVGLARPQPRLFELDEKAWRGPGAIGLAMAAALQDRANVLEVGILRVERALHRPADVRAALADPMLAPELARVLGRRATLS